MANMIGYEKLDVGLVTAVGPTASLVQSGVRCAIFYIDPDSACKLVRYRSDFNLSTGALPTTATGLPLRPGKSIVVAGEANVRNARFLASGGSAEIHCVYYDQVDVVDLGLSDNGEASNAEALESLTQKLVDQNDEILYVLRTIHNGMAEAETIVVREMLTADR